MSFGPAGPLDEHHSVHLETLLGQEYLVKRGEQYLLGMKLFHLGECARTRNEWSEVARRKAHDLADSVVRRSRLPSKIRRAITLFNVVARPVDVQVAELTCTTRQSGRRSSPRCRRPESTRFSTSGNAR